jgi:hypothetical protein
MNSQPDANKIAELERLESELKKVTGAKKRIFRLSILLLMSLLAVLSIAYKNLVFDFAEIDQVEMRWEPYMESVEIDYFVVTPGKLEFEYGDMLYRTRYKAQGKEHFSWGVPVTKGAEILVTARDGLQTITFQERIESMKSKGN